MGPVVRHYGITREKVSVPSHSPENSYSQGAGIGGWVFRHSLASISVRILERRRYAPFGPTECAVRFHPETQYFR